MISSAIERQILVDGVTPYTPPTFTAGGVLFADGAGAPTVDATNFSFDDATNQLAVTGSILSPLIIGGTGTTSDLILQATSGVGTTGSWIFFKVGNNGAVTAMEINHLGWVGIGTTGLAGLQCGLTVRQENPPDIGYVAEFRSNLSAYLLIKSGTGVNEQAGFTLQQTTNAVEWRFAVIGNEANAFRFSDSSTGVLYGTLGHNICINDSVIDPTTGSKCLLFGDGTAPSGLDSNTAGLYAEDVSGTVNMFAINEAGESNQLSGDIKIASGKYFYTQAAAFMIRGVTSYTDGAGALTGTLTNSPVTGNPTKWIPIDDNGVTRYIPAW